jgi:cbb3-type cytochrome oxidase maturation protein
MIVIFLLIPLSILIAAVFLGAFIWAVRSGQYEDTCTPAMRLLLEEKKKENDGKASAAKPDGEPSQPDNTTAKNE